MQSDLWAFTRFGPVNARTCPVHARVSITLPGLGGSSSSDSTLAIWAAEQRLAWVSLAFCVTLLARVVLTAQIWQSEQRPRGSRAAAARACKASSSLKNAEVINRNPATARELAARRAAAARASHMTCHWSRTGCKPDLEFSSWRYWYFFGAAAKRRCPVRSIDRRPPLAAEAGSQQLFEMLVVRM